MIRRYEIPEIYAIFSDEGKYKTWLEVELAAGEAMAELGFVPAEAVRACRNRTNATPPDPVRIALIEQTTRHDVIAFLEHLEEVIGPEARHLHLGMTSSDVTDTALALQMTRAHRILTDELDRLIGVLGTKALSYKDVPCIGRSHGVHAEPTTFGLKLATFYSQFRRDRDRLSAAAEGLRVGQISGAVGAYTTLSPEIEEQTCAKLGLKPSKISTQVLQRDRH
ncbi:adenylosuccinate lyase, partial [bacterium]|nr:adenylosuccinate lyase [bacterium]